MLSLILLHYLFPERKRVPDEDLLHCLQSAGLVFGAVAAAHAPAVAIAMPVVLEALAVEFEAAGVGTVA